MDGVAVVQGVDFLDRRKQRIGLPVVFRGVACLELDKLQIRDFVDGQLPADVGGLVVVGWASTGAQVVQQEVLHRIHGHGARFFVEANAHPGVVVELDGLAQVPHQVVGAFHGEVLVVRDRQFELGVVHVAHLEQLQGALNVGTGTESRGRQVEIDVPNKCQVFALDLFKGTKGDRLGLVHVRQGSTVILAVVKLDVCIAAEYLVEGISGIPIGEVQGSRILLHGRCGTVYADVGQGQAASLGEVFDQSAQGVPLCGVGQVFDGIVHLDVGIQGIVLRGFELLRHAHEERQFKALRPQDFAQFQVSLHVVGGRGKPVPFGGALVDGTKSNAAVQAGGDDLTQVRQFDAGAGCGGLSPFVFKVRHAEFVDPDLGAFVVAVVGAACFTFLAISDANQHRAHQT